MPSSASNSQASTRTGASLHSERLVASPETQGGLVALIGTALVASLVVSAVAISVLSSGASDGAELGARILYAWLGQVVGIAVSAPLLLRWCRPGALRLPNWTMLSWIEAAVQAISI